VYIDTNVLIYYLHPTNEEGERKAKAFFLDLQRGQYEGIISDFCRLEYTTFLKEEIAMIRSGKVTDMDMDLWLDKLDELIEEMGFEEVSSDSLLATPFITDCMKICKESGSTMNEERGEWVFIGAADCIHAVLASRCGAGFLATMDKGFCGLRDSVQPMVLWDKY
jgi:hypothetical protein